MAIEEDKVREALKQVIDPELFVNIVDLGLIYGVTISDAADEKLNVAIDMRQRLPRAWLFIAGLRRINSATAGSDEAISSAGRKR